MKKADVRSLASAFSFIEKPDIVEDQRIGTSISRISDPSLFDLSVNPSVSQMPSPSRL
jgi:hypothetical protein